MARSRTVRTFLLAGAGALAAHAAPPSDQVVLGVIGSGSRGTFVMGVFQKDPALTVGAICDVYEPNLENADLRRLESSRHASQGLPQLQGTARR